MFNFEANLNQHAINPYEPLSVCKFSYSVNTNNRFVKIVGLFFAMCGCVEAIVGVFSSACAVIEVYLDL